MKKDEIIEALEIGLSYASKEWPTQEEEKEYEQIKDIIDRLQRGEPID
jgi:hypothetical protein